MVKVVFQIYFRVEPAVLFKGEDVTRDFGEKLWKGLADTACTKNN